MARLQCAKRAVALIAVAAFLAGCSPTNARVGVGLPPAILFRNVRGAMTANRDVVRQRGGIPILDAPKIGRARAYQIQLSPPTGTDFLVDADGLQAARVASVGWGDMSLQKALKDGQIETFTHADYREISILGIFTQIDIYAYGE